MGGRGPLGVLVELDAVLVRVDSGQLLPLGNFQHSLAGGAQPGVLSVVGLFR